MDSEHGKPSTHKENRDETVLACSVRWPGGDARRGVGANDGRWLSQLKATVAVKGVLTKAQLEKLPGTVGCTSPPVPAATQKDDAPQGTSEHQQHH